MKPLPVVGGPAPGPLEIEGLHAARFECVFPTCGGVCCKNGRPPVEPAEAARIAANLKKVLPRLRPRARARVERDGFLTRRTKDGRRMLAVSEGWCVFEHGGCVLQQVGGEEGEPWRYKPWRCITFPIERPAPGEAYVRQWGLHGEAWDLFCLNPEESPRRAADTLGAEAEFTRALDGGAEAWRLAGVPESKTKKTKSKSKTKTKTTGR